MKRFGVVVLLSFAAYVCAQQSDVPDKEVLVEYMKYVKKSMDIIKKAVREKPLKELKKLLHDLFKQYLDHVPNVEWMNDEEKVDDFMSTMRRIAGEISHKDTRKHFKQPSYDNAMYFFCLARSDARMAMANLPAWHSERYSLVSHAREVQHRCAHDYLRV